MVVDQINILKKKLESQILQQDSYDKIYETSVEIDKLLVQYYNEYEKSKRDLKCLD